MPTYRKTNTNDALTCYTKRHLDFAFVFFPSRRTTKLVNGIYDQMTLGECYRSRENVDYSWFLLDFVTPVALYSLNVKFQTRTNSRILR